MLEAREQFPFESSVMSLVSHCGIVAALILASPVRGADEDSENKAASFLEERGGDLVRDEARPGKPVVRVSACCALWTEPELRALSRLAHLTELELGPISDAGAKELAQLTGLKKLALSGTLLTGAGLRELVPLQNLTHLNLSGTEINGAGLKELAGLRNLTALELPGTVTSTGLKELAGFKNLTTLTLWHAKITVSEAKELARLEALTTLNLLGAQVTDAGAKELGSLKSLTALHLLNAQMTGTKVKELVNFTNLTALSLDDSGPFAGDTGLTDADVKELGALKNLTFLTLGSTKVTDASVKDLSRIGSLTELDLRGTAVADAGVKELQKLLPKCKVHSGRRAEAK